MRILWGISPPLAAMTPVATSGPPMALPRKLGVLCGGVRWYPTLQLGFDRRADDGIPTVKHNGYLQNLVGSTWTPRIKKLDNSYSPWLKSGHSVHEM